MQSDLDLVRRSQEGDHRAYRDLVNRYEDRVYTLACSILGNGETARDAAQEAFVRAYQALPSFRGDAGLYTWIYRIVVNVSLNLARKESRRQERVSIDEMMESGEHLPEQLFSRDLPIEAAEAAELQEAIQAVLDQLSEDHRTVVVLKDIEDLSQEEIAEIVGCSVGTVKSRLSRARAQMRDLLRPIYDAWIGGETE